jgi:hypothetical protein
MSKQGYLDLTSQSSVPLSILGQVLVDEQGRRYIYAIANGTLTAGRFCIMSTDETYDMTPMTTALVGTPGTHWKLLGVPNINMTDNYYGWFWVGFGTFECVVENGWAAGDVLYTTANAGLPGTNSSSHILDGFKTIDAGVTSTRVTCFCANRLTAGVSMCSD